MAGLLRTGVVLVFAGLIGSAPAAAQTVPPCDTLLTAAQEHYVNQQFAQAEASLRDCLRQPEVDTEHALQSYRLLALVYLRQDDLTDAKQAVIQLLSVSFGYTPDPILDPPAYVALVRSIQDQLRVEVDSPLPAGPDSARAPAAGDAPPAVESATRTQRPYRPARAFRVGVSLGAGSYGGERGVDEPSALSEFSTNSGFSAEIEGAYSFSRVLSAAVSYRLFQIPYLLENDIVADAVQVVPGESSEWVHLLNVLARAHYGSGWRVSPFVQIGVSGLASRLNNETTVGIGPQGGLGLDVALAPTLGGFVTLSAAMIFPGDAVDGVTSNSTSSDLLMFVGTGLRYQIGSR